MLINNKRIVAISENNFKIKPVITAQGKHGQKTNFNMEDTIKLLQSEVQDLHKSISVLLVQLTEEKLARNALQNILINHFKPVSEENIKWPQYNL